MLMFLKKWFQVFVFCVKSDNYSFTNVSLLLVLLFLKVISVIFNTLDDIFFRFEFKLNKPIFIVSANPNVSSKLHNLLCSCTSSDEQLLSCSLTQLLFPPSIFFQIIDTYLFSNYINKFLGYVFGSNSLWLIQ